MWRMSWGRFGGGGAERKQAACARLFMDTTRRRAKAADFARWTRRGRKEAVAERLFEAPGAATLLELRGGRAT